MAQSNGDSLRVRASTVEGIFYPQQPARLREAVEGLLERSTTPEGGAQSIISPHAAFDYSGGVAASAFKATARRQVELAVLIGPVHREPADALLLCESEAFQTPLGPVAVDQELAPELERLASDFRYDEVPHLEEHCLEVQLPFLQVVHPRARILPLLLGRPSRKRIERLAEALLELTRDRLGSTLFVVSSNMSSFLSSTASDAEAREHLDRIAAMDWESMVEGPRRKLVSPCGGGCIAAILLLHQRIGGSVEVLQRASSLKAGGDPERVVEYAAVAIGPNES
jgi:AmmeMemoRadiSam system protein B